MNAAVLAALLACPAGPGSKTPRLAAAPDALYLSWQEPDGEGETAVVVARWDGKTWGPARTVVRRKNLFVNWADFPALTALDNGGLALSWLPKSAAGAYTYDVAIATSGDGGKSWGHPVHPHRDGTKSEHGFVSLVSRPGGRFTAIWLDGRRTVAKGPQALFAADWNGSAFEPETELDAKVCDCCGTAAVNVGKRLLVAYRDRSDAEVRDISLVDYADGRWSSSRALAADGWVIKGCPVNGPALAAKGDNVAAVWYTASASGDAPQVKLAFSKDGGRGFGKAVRLDSGAPAGRVDVVLLDDSSAVAAWLESGDKPALLARRVKPDGSMSKPYKIAGTTESRSSGLPRMVYWGGRVLTAWTDASGDKPRVHLSAFDPDKDLR